MDIHQICNRIFQDRITCPQRIHPVKWDAMLQSAHDFISTILLQGDEEYVMVAIGDELESQFDSTSKQVFQAELPALSAINSANELE